MIQDRTQDDFNRVVEEIQRAVDEQARATYSDVLIEQAQHPDHIGRLDEPHAYGRSLGWCGDMMEVYLRLDGDRVEAARFMTDGCGPTVACGNVLAQLVEGKTLAQAEALTPQQIAEALNGLPEAHFHCAELAVSTLQNALFNLRLERQET